MTPVHRTSKRNEAAQLKLLERLCTASGVSGDEGEVRAIVLEEARSITAKRGADVRVDVLGNVLVTLTGNGPAPRLKVLIAAHMDEIGLMVTADEGKGFFRFELVGGIDPRQLVGKPVLVGKSHVSGVIGAKPIHLTKADELKNQIPLDGMRIDIGPGGSGVKVGDRAAFATKFVRLGGGAVRAKALDNRLGVTALLELIKGTYPQIDLQAAFTTQEEVGGRGAMTAAYNFAPDIAIALDSTPAHDLPAVDSGEDPSAENRFYNTRLGAGPAIYTADSSTLSDPRLVRFLAETGEALKIPFQLRQPGGGGTDAGAMHRQRAGVPSVSISVPSRYQHTPMSIGWISDLQATIALLGAALERITPELIRGERL
jgi:endoglucanase